MTKTLSSLTIGIAAYNEASSIARLLRDLRSQNSKTYKLAQVLLVSDGSTDETVAMARSVVSLPLSIRINKERQGLATCLNYIFKHSRTDLVVTLDADIRIRDKSFLDTLLSPLIAGEADYVSSSITETIPKSFFASCLALSMQIKRNIYMAIGDGNNIYNSFGLARGYNTRVYQSMNFPVSIGNDMYSYLYTLTHHLRFIHVAPAVVSYSLPTSYLDSRSQSLRFHQARRSMAKYFSDAQVVESLSIPSSSLIKGLFKSLPLIMAQPLKSIVYLCYCTITLISSLHTQVEDKWQIATTSKHA